MTTLDPPQACADNKVVLSLNAIPKPSTNAPNTDAPDAPQVPLASAAMEGRLEPVETADLPAQKHDAEQMVDGVAVLLVLLIAGALLRLVLGLLGPLQGINTAQVEQAQQNGKQLLAGESDSAWPLFDLIAHGLATTGLPAWGLVLLGSLLTLACVPAAYVIGQTLTGRRAAGIVAAAVIAVHPAVLTASNSYASTAMAMGLVTIGLACICLVEQKGSRVAILGAVMLGCAALAAPLVWLLGLLAGPLTYKLARRGGAGKAFGLAIAITLIAAAPAAGYRAAFLGQSPDALLAEWGATATTEQKTTALQHLLVTMTHPSFTELGEAMHLPLKDAGRLKVTHAAPAAAGQRDVVADTLADGWLLLNAALAGLAAISIGVMIARRRWAETMILTLPLLALAFTALPPGETLRLPMLALVGVLATGLFATRSVPRIDEAAQQAKRLAKLNKQEEKERAKQQREVEKHKDSLYAFDKPGKTRRRKTVEKETPETDDTPQFTARPI